MAPLLSEAENQLNKDDLPMFEPVVDGIIIILFINKNNNLP